jgi:outer membrane immunogenic protein
MCGLEESMKRFLLASAGVILAGSMGAASAADLSRPPPMVTKAPYYAPYYNWTGFYAGINGGYGFGSSNWSALASSFDVNGGMFGGQIGYNWQFGQFVYGLEGDGDWTDLRGTGNALGCVATVCKTRNDFLATARGRIGYAADRWMPYLTGGLAVGNIRTTTPGFSGIDQTNAGWTVGGGLEVALVGNWTAKAEYLYVDLGNAGCGGGCGFGIPNNVGLTTNVVRGGINYRF